MKKIHTPFRRPNKSGWWICWYEGSKKKHKSFQTKQEAQHYLHIKYMQLNSDVYTNINIPFITAKDEYLKKYDLQRLSSYSKKQSSLIIDKFYKLCCPAKTQDITQKQIDYYALQIPKNLSGWSVNRELKTLRTFFNWLKSQNYIKTSFNYPLVKTNQPKSKALTDTQIIALIAACPTPEWKLRILLALSTGLRKNDLYRLKAADIDIQNGTILAQERKTGKTYTNYIPDKLLPFIQAHTPSNPYFFAVVNSRWLDKQFRKFRPDATITIQCLRKTFATRIETTSISTKMLNHSGTSVTRKFYNDLDYIKYIRVNQLPIDLWLDKN